MEGKEMKQLTTLLKKYAPCGLLLLLCAITPEAYFSSKTGLTEAALYHFTHTSIFHMALNFVVMARFCPRWVNVPVAYLSATASALAPFSGMSAPTCGISGIIFAMLARRDALLGVKNYMLLLTCIATGLLPMFNWKIHILSYAISFAIWRVLKLTYYRR